MRMSLKAKLIVVSAVLVLVPLTVSSIIINIVATQSASEALEETVGNQLVAIRDSKKSQIEDFENLDNTILDFSESNPFGDAGKES